MQTMVNGQALSYSAAGAGFPLVLIHGYPLSARMWSPQLRGLADTAQLVAPNLWGFADSAPVAAATMGTYADAVRALMDERGIDRAVICGLSMGGYITFEFCDRYPDRVAGVVLANTKSTPDTPEGKAGRDKSAELARTQGADAIIAAMLPKLLAPANYAQNPALVVEVREIMRQATVPGIVSALGAMRDRPDYTPLLARINRPALVIGGTEDQLFPRAEFDRMVNGLPDARLVLLPEAGHLSNLEQPDLFNDAIKEFLKRVG